MSVNPNRRHVVRREQGWADVAEGATRAAGIHRTQAQAEAAAKASVARNGGGEVVIHDRTGKIRDSDTIGKADPLPPRDKKH